MNRILSQRSKRSISELNQGQKSRKIPTKIKKGGKYISSITALLVIILLGDPTKSTTTQKYQVYTGAVIQKDDVNDITIDQSGAPVISSRTSGEIYRVRNFGTHFRIEAGSPYHIVVHILDRGATLIMICINERDEPKLKVEDDEKTFEIECYEMDLTATLQLDDYHILEKKFTGPGYLTIYNFESESGIATTEFKVTSVRHPPGSTTCLVTCENGGTCQSGSCKCAENYIGVNCDRKVSIMSDDLHSENVRIPKHNAYFFLEDMTKGLKEISISVSSKSRPKMMLVVNEATKKDFKKFSIRDKDSRKILVTKMSTLRFGQYEDTFYFDDEWAYFMFVNHENNDISAQLSVERVRNNTLSTVAYVLYIVIMITIIILFVLILCAACFKPHPEEEEANQPARQNNRRTRNGESDGDPRSSQSSYSSDDEDDKTLLESDYNRFFPLIQNETEEKINPSIKTEICSICIDKILNGEPVRKIKFCGHYFHDKCLRDWLKVDEVCPNCKYELNRPHLIKQEALLIKKKKLNPKKSASKVFKAPLRVSKNDPFASENEKIEEINLDNNRANNGEEPEQIRMRATIRFDDFAELDQPTQVNVFANNRATAAFDAQMESHGENQDNSELASLGRNNSDILENQDNRQVMRLTRGRSSIRNRRQSRNTMSRRRGRGTAGPSNMRLEATESFQAREQGFQNLANSAQITFSRRNVD